MLVAAFMVAPCCAVKPSWDAQIVVEDDTAVYHVSGTFSRKGQWILPAAELVADVDDRFEVDVMVLENLETGQTSATVLLSPNANSRSDVRNIRFRPGTINYCDFQVRGAYEHFTITGGGEVERQIAPGLVLWVTVNGTQSFPGYTLHLPLTTGCAPTVSIEPVSTPTSILFQIDANRLLTAGDPPYDTVDLVSIVPGTWRLTIQRTR